MKNVELPNITLTLEKKLTATPIYTYPIFYMHIQVHGDNSGITIYKIQLGKSLPYPNLG